MKKDFWGNSKTLVLGGGSWGTVLAQMAAQNCAEVRLWVRSEEQARSINSTRTNTRYVPELHLRENIVACSDVERAFSEPVSTIIWALPSHACRERAREFARYFQGDELILHATKGVEQGSLKRISEVLREELPIARIGVLSGPNLAQEVARGEPAATVVASAFREVVEAGQALLTTPQFLVYIADDVVGVEWAGALKNILAIASGCLEALGLGWNARGTLISRGIAEMVRFGQALGARPETFLGLAGVGDLLATCSSALSRNFRVGYEVASGKKISDVLEQLGSTAEGVLTARSVFQFASERNIRMPITEAVNRVLSGEAQVADLIQQLMLSGPVENEFGG